MAAHTYIYGMYRWLRACVCRTVRGPTASSLSENSRWVNRKACWWRGNTSGDLPHGPILMACSAYFEKRNSELGMMSHSRQNSSGSRVVVCLQINDKTTYVQKDFAEYC